MKRAISVLAFLSSLVVCVVFVGGGLFLLFVENSGERATGALLALFGAIAATSGIVLSFAGDGTFGGPWRRTGPALAAAVAAIPVAALAVGAVRFAGLPFGSSMPGLDWSLFAGGMLLALGAAAIVTLGYFRSRPAPEPEPLPDLAMELRSAREQLRSAFEDRAAGLRPDAEDDPPVTHVRRNSA